MGPLVAGYTVQYTFWPYLRIQYAREGNQGLRLCTPCNNVALRQQLWQHHIADDYVVCGRLHVSLHVPGQP